MIEVHMQDQITKAQELFYKRKGDPLLHLSLSSFSAFLWR